MSSIEKYNNFRNKLFELNGLEIPGSQKLMIIQKALLFGPYFMKELENYLENIKTNLPPISHDARNIVLTGCSIFINDELIDLIEEGGGNIVFFDTWIGNHYISQAFDDKIIDSNKNPLDLLVVRFQNNIYDDHSISNYLENKLSLIENYSRDYLEKTGKKLGVVNHIIKFCDHMLLMSSFLKDKLQERGIPVLNLERDYSRANRGQLSTRVEAFLEMM